MRVITIESIPFNATGGEAGRSLSVRFGDVLTPEDFGALGDGVTNDYAAFQAAIDYLGGTDGRGGVLYCAPKKYRITGAQLFVSRGVTIRGQTPVVGHDGWLFDFASSGTVLMLDGSFGLKLDFNAGLEDCILLRYGWTKPNDAAEAGASIAAFAGTAVSVHGADTVMKNLAILAFDRAIDQTRSAIERPRWEQILIDCNKGIRIGLCSDLGYIERIHGFPVTTAHRPWQTDAVVTRTGPFFEATGTFDWGKVRDGSCFGYTSAWKIANSDNVSLINCGADHVPSYPSGTVGIEVIGACRDFKALDCQFAAMETAVKLNFTGTATVDRCSAWGSKIHVDVVAGNAEIGRNYWHYLRPNGTGIRPIRVGAGAGKVRVIDNVFEDGWSSYPIGDVVDVNAAVLANFVRRGNQYITVAADDGPLSVSGLIASNNVLARKDGFRFDFDRPSGAIDTNVGFRVFDGGANQFKSLLYNYPNGRWEINQSPICTPAVAIEALRLTDGVAAPPATVGAAKIYVDAAGGDLKVIFGDGTVKTIVLDT